MGKPLPGIDAFIVQKRDDGTIEEVREPNIEGELALRPGWPSMFRGYLNQEDRYRKCFAGGYYLTGDLARRDGDGYFWFIGRADDVILSAGYRIGPSEIENCLLKHPAVANAAVIGKPDPERTHIVKAFIVLVPGRPPSAELEAELQQHVRGRLAPYEYPKEIEFIDSLPMTTTGKVQRRVLRQREEERKNAGRA